MFSSDTTQVSDGGYQISRSLRFNSADSAYLNRTPASASNRKTWTWSAWVKRGTMDRASRYTLFASRPTANPYTLFYFSGSTQTNRYGLRFEDPSADLATTQVFRDPSAWYHIVLAVDTTQATASNRIKMYVNGSQITVFSTASYPSQNTDMSINNNTEQCIGNNTFDASTESFDGYITETNFIDGTQLTPSSFGETNAQTGVWQPKAYSGSYGTNGFYLNFSDNSNTTAATLGKDYSGNGNNWTPNNFSVTAGAGNDSLVDSPTSYGTDTGVGGTVRGNYATLNPLNAGNSAYLNNGNLAITNPSEGAWRTGVATIAMSSGKWYAEVTVTNNQLLIGIDKASVVFTGTTTFIGGSPTGWGVLYTGQVYNNSGVVYNNSNYAAGDIIGLAFDADTGVMTWYKNNVAMSQTITGLTSGPYVFGVSATSAGNANINFGQRPFAYTAPSGYKALCTQNLPTPTIGATTATQAGKFFNTVTWIPSGQTTVTGVGFQPDFTWWKNRNAEFHVLADVNRGNSAYLKSNSTDAEATASNLWVPNSDGWTSASGTMTNGNAYVGWNWKANGSGSTNTAGSITSTVSANTTSGFSVVTWTGNNGSGTVGHGLGVAPAMYIVKNRTNAGGWVTYHSALGATKYLTLQSTDAATTSSIAWNDTAPTSTVFSIASGAFGNTNNYVTYCFAEVSGYSKAFSYTGNGSTDGVFVYTGFRPAYVIVKCSSSGGTDWIVEDATRSTTNVVDARLFPNTSDAEISNGNGNIDFLSNGFKLRNSHAGMNASGSTYIGFAFASVPTKFSLAR